MRGVPPCNIQRGKSKQASRAFGTAPTASSVLRDSVSLSVYFSLSLSCSPQPFAIPLLAVPSHQLGRNLFRLQLSFRVLLPILIPSISHYPANSSPTWPSQKSSSSTSSIPQPDASRSMCSSRLFHISFESAGSYFPRIGVYIIFYCLLDSACRLSYYN